MELKVQNRKIKKKKVKDLRKQGIIPIIAYSKFLENPLVLSCNKNEFVKIYKQAGYSTPITLKGDGIEQIVLINDIQIDPIYDTAIHVDFLAIKAGEKVSAEVPIHLKGEAPVEKRGEGNVQQVKDSIEVIAIPSKLPSEILIDISHLESTNDSIFLRDIKLPDDVETEEDLEQVIITVMTISEEEIEEDVVETIEGEEGEGGEEETKEGESSDSEKKDKDSKQSE